MFGFLRRWGDRGRLPDRAPATVLDVQLLNHRADGEHTRPHYEFIVDVRPVTGAPFRTTVRQRLARMTRVPQIGDEVTAAYAVDRRHTRLELVGDPRFDLSLFAAQVDRAQAARRDAILDAPAGSPVTPAEIPFPATDNAVHSADGSSEARQ